MHCHFPQLKVERQRQETEKMRDVRLPWGSLSWWKWMWLDSVPVMGTVWQAGLYPVKQGRISPCLTEYRWTKMTLLKQLSYSAGITEDGSTKLHWGWNLISLGIRNLRMERFGLFDAAGVDLLCFCAALGRSFNVPIATGIMGPVTVMPC